MLPCSADTERVMQRIASGRRFGLAIALLAVVVLPLLFGSAGARAPKGLLRDFDAFYCAGDALGRDRDPYRSEPLGSCERRPKPAIFRPGTPGLAMPAPLPPYALAPFILLARLPFVAAAVAWSLLLLASIALTVFALRRLTQLPLATLTASVALIDGYAPLCLGQVAPLAVAGIALAALMLHEGRERSAAALAALSMIEPHVALPACLALFIFRPRSRSILILSAAALTVLSFAVAGGTTNLEYLRDVLPAHALSEVANAKQISLTYGLHRLGMTDALAVRIGEIWYLAMIALGIAGARLAQKSGRSAASLITLPVGLALVGGPFVHVVQIAAAMPAALLLFAESSGIVRRWLGAGIILVAVPWVQFSDLGTIFVALSALVVGILIASLLQGRPALVAMGGLAAIAFGEVSIALLRPVPNVVALLLARYDPNALAEQSWTLYVRAIGPINAHAFDVAKAPTVVGLLVLTFAAAYGLLHATKIEPFSPLASAKRKGAETSRRIAFR